MTQKTIEELLTEKGTNSWNWTATHIKLTEDFIATFQDKMDWNLISEFQTLSESFIKRFSYKVNWNIIIEKYKFSIDFLEDFYYMATWFEILINQNLTEEFIRKYAHLISPQDWRVLCYYQSRYLSEQFYRDYETMVDWEMISVSGDLSEQFIIDYWTRLSKSNTPLVIDFMNPKKMSEQFRLFLKLNNIELDF
jgi:hypothetical protein